MKKRILALFMALALCLGLAPAVLADDAPEIGLFMGTAEQPFQRNQDGVVIAQCGDNGALTGLQLRVAGWKFSAMNTTVSNGRITVSDGPVAENKTDYLSVYCTAGDTTDPVFFFRYHAVSKTITFEGFSQPGDALSDGFARYQMRICFVKPNSSGNQGGNGDAPSIRLYYADDNQCYINDDGVTIVNCAADGSMTGLKFKDDGGGWIFSQPSTTVFGADGRVGVSAGADSNSLSVYCTAGDASVDPQFFFAYNASTKVIKFEGFSAADSLQNGFARVWRRVSFSKSTNQGGNPLLGFSLVQAAGAASAVSVIAGGNELIHPVKVLTVDGVDFYVGIRRNDGIDDNPLMNKGKSFSQGDTSIDIYKVGFWIGEPNGDKMNYWAVTQNQYDDLFARCSDLQFSLMRMSDCTDLSPAFYRSDSAPARMALVYGYRTVGTWVPVLTGSFSGAPFISYGAFGCHQYVGEVWEPTQEITLDEVSAFFANAVAEHPDENYYKVVLPYAPAGYAGTVTIPAVQGHLTGSFYIEGKPGPNGERQVIRGGINAQGGTTQLLNLSFISTKEKTDPTNVCGSGAGEIRATNCRFAGYYHAMECDGDQNFKLGFTDCKFIDNKTAVYMRATGYVSGNCHLQGSLFQNNEIALDLEQFSPMFGLHVYKVYRCRFINNRCDVKNCTGHVFFMPENYFLHDQNPANVPSADITKMILCPFSTDPVSAFPRALNAQFTAFDYSDPNPLLAIGGGVLIPINALPGKLITMITQGSTPDLPDVKSYFWRFGA